MRTIDALSAAAAEAIEEDEEILKWGTNGMLQPSLRRQAFFLVLHREGRLKVSQIADWSERPHRTIWGIIQSAGDAYDVGDEDFFSYYTPAQQAIANCHHENPSEDDDA